MKPAQNILGMAMAATLLVALITTSVEGQTWRDDSAVFGGKWRKVTQVVGTVICAECTLHELQMAQPGNWHVLHQLSHRLGQMVLKVSAVNGSRIWNVGDLHPEVWVQAEDHLFQQLTAEENLFKEVEITGLLRNTQLLETSSVRCTRKPRKEEEQGSL